MGFLGPFFELQLRHAFRRYFSLVNEVDDETCALLESLLPASAVRANRMAPSKKLPSIGEVIERKKQKRIITEGTDLFNQDPKKGRSACF